jgi:hypothetical protein
VDQALRAPQIFAAGMDFQIISLVVLMRVERNAVAGESTRHQALNGLVSLLA